MFAHSETNNGDACEKYISSGDKITIGGPRPKSRVEEDESGMPPDKWRRSLSVGLFPSCRSNRVRFDLKKNCTGIIVPSKRARSSRNYREKTARGKFILNHSGGKGKRLFKVNPLPRNTFLRREGGRERQRQEENIIFKRNQDFE